VNTRDREVHRFWSSTPLRALAPLLAGVFFTFAGMGFLVDVARRGEMQSRALAAIVAFCGVTAVAYALIGMRRRYWLFAPALALQLLMPRWIERLWPPATPPSAEALAGRLVVDAIGALASLALGYGFFMMFIVGQGRRRVRTDAEMELAREIHASLVPELSLAAPGCEIYGRSLPASEVGGDLVDALVLDGRAFAVVADVSGHGVPAGMLMGLLKSGWRVRLKASGDLGDALADLNDVLADLTRPNAFATAAMLSLSSPTRVAFALAGHPPILHLRQGDSSVARLGNGGMALGIRPGERYLTGEAEVGAGDVLAVLTDGFTETMDGAGTELGLGPIEAALVRHSGAPLARIADALVSLAGAHGPQQDDRTLLLVRVTGGSAQALP
jgi:sigma-B regulation protein RsbU (phosphoserine phosphatase)